MKSFLILLLFVTIFSTKEKTPNLLILTNHASITNQIFYFLNYLEIQEFFKCIEFRDLYFLSDKDRYSNIEEFFSEYNYSDPKQFFEILRLEHQKQIFISLSKLRQILLSNPKKFEKRIFRFGIYEEFFTSKDNAKNIDTLPENELENIRFPVYSFLIKHAIRLNVNNLIKYIILRNDGVCQIFGTTDIFRRVIDLFQIENTHVSKDELKFMATPPMPPIYSLANQKFESMYFSFNFDTHKQYLHLFLEDAKKIHITFWWPEKHYQPQIKLPVVAIIVLYANRLQLKPFKNGLGLYTYDTESKCLHQQSHVFGGDGNFIVENESFMEFFAAKEFDALK